MIFQTKVPEPLPLESFGAVDSASDQLFGVSVPTRLISATRGIGIHTSDQAVTDKAAAAAGPFVAEKGADPRQRCRRLARLLRHNTPCRIQPRKKLACVCQSLS